MQYTKYCGQIGFQLFRRTTMLTILAACSATMRNSLQVFNYIAAEGSRAFDNFCQVVKCLEECEASKNYAAEKWTSCMTNTKQYLKSDFKLLQS